eukprot:SAG31_NODE_2853_length_4992_cov_5.719599_3_plen_50_part_00
MLLIQVDHKYSSTAAVAAAGHHRPICEERVEAFSLGLRVVERLLVDDAR